MQWNCPHCGIKLLIGDDSIHTGWSFSKCFKCAGFALVRKAEVNVIKVDKAPPGENVLLPDGLGVNSGSGLISESATRKLVRHLPPPPPPRRAQNRPGVPGIPAPLPGVAPPRPVIKRAFRAMPLGLALATLTSVGSGAYLYVQAQALWNSAQTQAVASRAPLVIVDQIQDTATAPIKDLSTLDPVVHSD